MTLTLDQLFEYALVPPGNGVYTVHTAEEVKSRLHQCYYQESEKEKIYQTWKEQINSRNKHQVFLLGVPSDAGGGIQRGANWGPLYCREFFIKLNQIRNSKNLPFLDLGDILVNPHLLHDKYLNEETILQCQRSMYGGHTQQIPVSPLSLTQDFLELFYQDHPDAKVLTLGGDHGVSSSTASAFLKKRAPKGKTAIIHFDAHTDLLEERLGIDSCFATWCHHALPLLASPGHLIQLGIRSSGKNKAFWEKRYGIQQYWTDEINRRGVDVIFQKVHEYLLKHKVSEIFISFDIDALDESVASATGTPEPHGLNLDQCCQLIDKLCHPQNPYRLTGSDLMEVAPNVKHERIQSLNPEPESTLIAASVIMNKIIEGFL